jgi:threonine synthase
MWRYRELLPLATELEPISLGETITPLVHVPKLGRSVGLGNLWIKDESRLPTGSFKARGLAMAVTMAKLLGLNQLAIPTAGNAGGALAAYAARADMEAYIFMPHDTPLPNQIECIQAGAKVYLVDGLINDCARFVREGKPLMKWFDVSTLKEPYRIEGKKTMGLELADQLEWQLPDVIVYPTGGGTGLIGMWKAFDELHQLGWLNTEKRPRMIAVQSSGCAPIVRAYQQGQRFAEFWEKADTVATGLRVPAAVGDFMILDAIRESNGFAVAADESKIPDAVAQAASLTGLSICPETAACILATEHAVRDGNIHQYDHVVIFNTATAQKYPPTNHPMLPMLGRHAEIHAEMFT